MRSFGLTDKTKSIKRPEPKPWWKDTIIGVLAHPSNVSKK
jgi:hypothetical protein